MKKFSLSFLSLVVFVSVFFSSVSFAATIGQQLTAPEAGWKRYDDSDPSVKFFGTFVREPGANFYNGTANYATSADFKIQFDFIGTKIRIIGLQYMNKFSNASITIDGITETFSQIGSLKYQVLQYEKTGLENKRHTVEIALPSDAGNNIGFDPNNMNVRNIQIDAIDIDASGYLTNPNINAPILTAAAGNNNVVLNWTTVTGATSYNIKRSTNAGGPYVSISPTVTGTTYTDAGVTNGTTYYYIVTAINANGESAPSNEASATPFAQQADRAILTITMTNGLEKEYDVSATELSAFLAWYDAKDAGTGPAKFKFVKTWNKGPFKARSEYVIFDKILAFNVDEYDDVNP